MSHFQKKKKNAEIMKMFGQSVNQSESLWFSGRDATAWH